MSRRAIGAMIAGIVALAVAASLRMVVGDSGWGWPEESVVLGLRGTRLTLGLTVGGALAASGVALQALLRNPLAEPYILGLSTGAGAGVMIQTALVYRLGLSMGPQAIGAALGAMIALGVVYRLAVRRGVLDPLGLLLTGVIVSTIGGALILAASAAVGPGQIRDDLIQWMMGEFDEAEARRPGVLPVAAGLVILGTVFLAYRGPMLDLLALSTDEARALGVAVHRERRILLLLGSLLAALAVAISGPVAFVGLIGPHLARVTIGPAHRPLAILAVIFGAALVVLADVAGDVAGDLLHGSGRMPLGVFTALIGGPIFLALMRPGIGRGRLE